MVVGRTTLEHRVLAANIVDNFILGLDVMGKFEFVLDLKNRVVKFGMND